MNVFDAITSHLKSLALTLATTFVVLGATSLQAKKARESSIGRKTQDFTLTEAVSGRPWNLSEQAKRNDAIVLYFNSVECPVTNRYLPILKKLQERFADRQVTIATINSNQHDSLEDIQQHAGEFGLEFSILQDASGEVARSLGAKRTAEAILLDRHLKVRYRGVVDDRFERGTTRPRAKNNFLADAIDAVLKGRMVDTSLTRVEACPLNLAPEEKPSESSENANITYTEHAATIIQRRCQSCHRPEGIGPFELMTYDDARSWATSIREVVTQDLMPPWHADASHGHFSNDRSLTDQEYATLLDWIDGGTLEGDLDKLPEPRVFAETWSIGTPDLVLKMEKAVTIPAETPELGVPYKYIWAGAPFEREMWVQAAEVHPDATDVVHHASVYIVPQGVKIELENDERPTGLLAELSSPINSLPHLVSFVPGDNAFMQREGLAVRIPKGARLVFEMHYTPTGKQATDQTEVALKFAKEPPQHEVHSSAMINYWFSIPPRASNHQVRAKSTRFKQPVVLLTMNPHMHYRGKSIKYELVKPSGERSLLLNVPRYNFDWQSTYVLAEPVEIPKGSRIECTAAFDNSADNPFNPDPDVRVGWGEQTWQEMMLASFEYYEK